MLCPAVGGRGIALIEESKEYLESMADPTGQQPTPDWASSAEIIAQLSRLEQPHRQKKVNTVLLFVDAKMAGRAEDTVFESPLTCTRTNFYKWKKNPTFADVLTRVQAAAQHWQDTEAARALQKAAKRLALTAPVAAARLARLLDSADEGIVLRASTSILDRAGIETAPQTVAHSTSSSLEEWRIAAEQRRALVEAMGYEEQPDDADLVEMTGAGAVGGETE